MPCLASLQVDQRFHKVVWGTSGMAEGTTPAGLIVGGADRGMISMYDANKLIKGEENALVFSKDKHTGPVSALDFNPFQSNLLASGGSESGLYIWDVNKLGTPMTPGIKSQPLDDVRCVAWNRQVQHILASTFSSRCVVWDLRKNDPIIKMSDSTNHMRWKVVSWHPDVATQLCIASEDDHTPVIQIWDIRLPSAPLKTLEGHHKGVLSVAWCQADSDLLLSSGKDNRMLVWNPNSGHGEIVVELPTSNQCSFDVSWCPGNPSMIASASFDGRVSLYSLMGGQQQQIQPNNRVSDSFRPGLGEVAEQPQHTPQVACQLKSPPKWLRRPCGATFGFGGQLVSFETVAGVGGAPGKPAVYISSVITEPELVGTDVADMDTAGVETAGVTTDMKTAEAATDMLPRSISLIGGNFPLYHTNLLSSLSPQFQTEVLSQAPLMEHDHVLPAAVKQHHLVTPTSVMKHYQEVPYSATDCLLQTGDSIGINVHIGILTRVWPFLAEILSINSCLCETFVIILPETNTKTIHQFLDLVYRGCCKIKDKSEEKNVKELLSNIGISLDLSSSFTEFFAPVEGLADDDNTGAEIIIGQCFEEGEDDVSIASFQNCFESGLEFEDTVSSSPIKFQPEDFNREELCSKSCSNRCHRVVELWTPKSIADVGSLFKSDEGIVETKNRLVRHLWSQSHIGVPTDSYIVNNHTFCLKAFARLTGNSEYVVKSVLVDFWNGQSLYQHGNSGSLKQQSQSTTNFICWLKLFAESYGQFAPDSNTTILSYWLSKQYLFTLYLEETMAPHLSLSAFYQNFKKYFSFKRCDKSLPHVIISKYSSHSICTQCVALNNSRRQCKTEAQLKQATELKNQHKVIFSEARRKIQEIKQSALLFPSDNLFIQAQIFKQLL